jgi:hypothetical protein
MYDIYRIFAKKGNEHTTKKILKKDRIWEWFKMQDTLYEEDIMDIISSGKRKCDAFSSEKLSKESDIQYIVYLRTTMN